MKYYHCHIFIYYIVTAITAICHYGCTITNISSIRKDNPAMILTTVTAAGITDGRSRFRELFCGIMDEHGVNMPDYRPCENALWRLSDEPYNGKNKSSHSHTQRKLKLVIVPGIFGECIKDVAIPFSDAILHLKSYHRYNSDVIMVSGRSSSDFNARQIRDALRKISLQVGEKLVLIGYSKGTADILEALVNYPETHKNVFAVVSDQLKGSAEFIDSKIASNVSISRCPPPDPPLCKGGI